MSIDSGDGFGLGAFGWLVAGAVMLVVVSIVLMLGLALTGGMAASMDETAGPVNKTASPNPATGRAVSFEDTGHAAHIDDIFEVRDSTGYAIELTGANDSWVSSKQSVELAGDDTWSVSTWARVDPDGDAENQTMTAISANGRVLIKFNGTDGNWSAWYYSDSSTSSYRVNVSAPDQPGDLTLVTATSNGTHLTIYANTTQGEVANLSTESIVDVGVNSTHWDGTIEETRVFDDATNDSEQAALLNNPVAPRPGRNRTARLTYDEGSGGETAIYFTGVRASLSNATWTKTGHPGHELAEGTDYEIDDDSGSITALAGGRIDGAPVVWIDYRYTPLSRVGEVSDAFLPAFGLFSSALIAIPAAAILGVLIGGLLAAVSVAKPEFGRSGGRNQGR